jgi:hypothetical protein
MAARYAHVVDGLAVFCGDVACSSLDADGRLLFVDRTHVSHAGSRRLAREIMQQLAMTDPETLQ